ncbi:hypothetical protein V866_002454 [Kwoniella sp. B9012]
MGKKIISQDASLPPDGLGLSRIRSYRPLFPRLAQRVSLIMVALCYTLYHFQPWNESTLSRGPQQLWDNHTFVPSSEIRSTGLTDEVQWDGYSLFIRGERVVLWSGEIHPWRAPNPQLHLDLLQRIKALGFNSISIYTFWGLNNPSQGVLDFEGWKGFEPLLMMAREVGLWVVARPGPYINAEVTGGGIPAWVASLPDVKLRTNDTVYTEAYLDYWLALGKIFAKHQVTNNGSIIEYVLDDEGTLDLAHIGHLEKTMRDVGIVVPLTFNDVAPKKRLFEGPSAVDIYGLDSYPAVRECSKIGQWNPVRQYREYMESTSGKVGTPYYIPEMQAGWIPLINTKGYQQCLTSYDSDFERVFYLNNLANGIKLHNVYMVYGGVNYGHSAFPVGITSYDYWAPISEDRSLKDKYYELKSISHFVRSSRDLPKTYPVSTLEYGTLHVDQLVNPDTQGTFYVARHIDSTSREKSRHSLIVQDEVGKVDLPVYLNGRDSRILSSNYCWGNTCILHTSASIFTSTTIGNTDILVLYAPQDEEHRLAFPPHQRLSIATDTICNVKEETDEERKVLNFQVGQGVRDLVSIVGGRRKVEVILLDSKEVSWAWEAVVEPEHEEPYGAYYRFGRSENVLVLGPYFLRSAKSLSNTSLSLHGDLNATTLVNITCDPKYKTISWNNQTLNSEQHQLTNIREGRWSAVLPGPDTKLLFQQTEQRIHEWKYKDGLPEVEASFNDSTWKSADKKVTKNPFQPYDKQAGYEGEYVLYGTEYRYGVGSLMLRGEFRGVDEMMNQLDPKERKDLALKVSLISGPGGVGTFWLNGVYLGSGIADIGIEEQEVNLTLRIPHDVIRQGRENVLTIVMDPAPLEEAGAYTGTAESISAPRGIRGYSLLGGNTSAIEWKIQGNMGGWEQYPDKVRGVFNVGGLYGERKGWNLPGYNDEGWENQHLDEENQVTADLGEVRDSGAGLGWWRGRIEVDYPEGLDLHYSFIFPRILSPVRGQLFVNGWQLGRFYGDLGPQYRFPIPPGILAQGNNTIAISLFGYDKSADPKKFIEELVIEVDEVVTTTSLKLREMKLESPSWEEVFHLGHKESK